VSALGCRRPSRGAGGLERTLSTTHHHPDVSRHRRGGRHRDRRVPHPAPASADVRHRHGRAQPSRRLGPASGRSPPRHHDHRRGRPPRVERHPGPGARRGRARGSCYGCHPHRRVGPDRVPGAGGVVVGKRPVRSGDRAPGRVAGVDGGGSSGRRRSTAGDRGQNGRRLTCRSVLAAIIWGLVQGLSEFLPISSSGHLVLVPAFLSAAGWELDEPSLTVSAVLHLGTLLAVLIYFRTDIVRLLRFRRDPGARRLWMLLLIGTIPALVGLPLKGALDAFQDEPRKVGGALVATGVILLLGSRLVWGKRTLEEGRPLDAVMVGIAQAFALIPGISRSGSTIVVGSLRGLTPTEAARY